MALLGWLALVPLLLFGLVGTAVAIKLLLLARRTKQLPEFSISMSALLLGTLGLPLAVAGRSPANFNTPLGSVLFAAGMFFACAGLQFTFIFCWNVFRRDAKWARALVVVSAFAFMAVWTSMMVFGIGGADAAAAQAQIFPYAIMMIVLQISGAVWSASESFIYWNMQRRRLRLGLASPVVVQRFMLWGVSNLATVFLGSVMIMSLLSGKMIMRDPLSLVVLGVIGTVLSVTWGISFFPPKAYVRWVESGHETAA
ncbi:MAG: hypothetical protein ACI8W3_000293 [Myxococcota bacterium]